MDFEDETRTVVCDNGSGFVKAGFAGDDAPCVVIPSLIGRPRNRHAMMGIGQKEMYFGDEAQAKRGVLRLNYPVDHGIVKDWEAMEKLWEYTFDKELKVTIDEHPVLLTEAPLSKSQSKSRKDGRDHVRGLRDSCYLYSNPSCPLLVCQWSYHRDCDGLWRRCHTCCTNLRWHVVPHAIQRLDLAGKHLTDNFTKLLTEEGHLFTTSAEREIVRDIKERLTYVAINFEKELSKSRESSAVQRQYELPDGQVITIGTGRFKCPEVLFDPSRLGMESGGIQEIVFKSICRCDMDIRREMFSNVVLSGGNTLIPGLADRLAKELRSLAPPAVRVRVVAPPERKYSVWIGGSILASLSTFEQMWITKDEYMESGSSIVHMKCF